MKTLVTIPDESIEKIQEYRKKYCPHLSLGKFITHCTIETINNEVGKKNDR